MTTFSIVIAALVLDALLGEPRRYHPLVGFGRLAQLVEHRLYGDSVWRGSIATLLVLSPPLLLVSWGSSTSGAGILLETFLLYLTVGWNSLQQHARHVQEALEAGNLHEARRYAGLMVSRDTAHLDEEGVARATVESVLENGNDALFGTLFWFALAGAPGAVGYRLVNTLDAMWGYRDTRYSRFGRTAARLDDLLNLIPARLTAFGYLLAGEAKRALRCWKKQAPAWKSLNAGVVMAAGAGSLGVRLGGDAWYGGILRPRPPLGEGRRPASGDIERALRLVRDSMFVWLTALLIGGLLVETLIR